MKTPPGSKSKRASVKTVAELDNFDDVVLFPKKLAQANAQLQESGPPGLLAKKPRP